MARKVSSMSLKAVAAVVAVAEGTQVNVSAVCRTEGCSRKTFYKWVHRYREGGLDGLVDRSTRPHRSPGQVASAVEDEIVRLRKELADAGLDHGATTIHWHLGRGGGHVPSVAGIHRVLVRRGLVVPQPAKRPKSSWIRFEAAAPNERWQIDAMDWVIATGLVRVFNIVDDHSRVAIGSRAVLEATTDAAWATFSHAAGTWGLPAGVLSDNGLCFSGKLRGFEVLFEANLRDAGIRPSTGRPYHPETTGKVERFQQTLKKWLRRQPLAADLAELQDQLDRFCHIYNHERPHQGIGRQIPIDRWNAGLPAQPATGALDHPEFPATRRIDATVLANGAVSADFLIIHLGVEWAGLDAVVLLDTDRATVLVDGQLVRHLTLDRTRRYQPSGRTRGGPRRPRPGLAS
jgi:transposase InsO family protein